MLLCAVLLHGGCGSRTTEETEKESIEIKEVATPIWRLVLEYKIRGEYLNACKDDYVEGGVNNRVKNLVMEYALKEHERLKLKQ